MQEIIKSQIEELLKKYNCELVSFEYYEKVFGNIVLKVRCFDEILHFVTDRGEIYYGNKLLCNHTYLRCEKKTTPQKLLEQVENVIMDKVNNA